MILEYCQLLSTAHRVLDGYETVGLSKSGRKAKRWVIPKSELFPEKDNRESTLYSATHINHPSAVWCRQTAANYHWLYKLLVCLCSEYTYRYGKIHKCQSSGLVDALEWSPANIPAGMFTQPTPAMPDEVKIVGDSLASYRNYYNLNKTHLASWKGKVNSRSKPEWYIANI